MVIKENDVFISYYEWLIKFKNIDTPIGDLAMEISNDPKFPKDANSLKEIISHINNTVSSIGGAHYRVLEIAEYSWAFYQIETGYVNLEGDKIVPAEIIRL